MTIQNPFRSVANSHLYNCIKYTPQGKQCQEYLCFSREKNNSVYLCVPELDILGDLDGEVETAAPLHDQRLVAEVHTLLQGIGLGTEGANVLSTEQNNTSNLSHRAHIHLYMMIVTKIVALPG